MAVTQTSNVLYLNDAHTAAVTEYTRTTSRGTSQRFGVVIRQEALGVNLDEVAAGRGIAAALVEEMRERLRKGRKAATSTLVRRAVSAAAWARGDSKTRDRYEPAGARLKNKPPGGANSDAVLQDSGRLIDGLTATATRDGNFAFNVAKGRLDPSTWRAGKGAPGIEIVFNLMMQLIDVATLGQADRVQAAVEASTSKMITKYSSGVFQLKRAVQDLAQNLGDLGETLGEVAE